MNTQETLALLYLVLSIAAIWVGAMLAWLLAEAAILLHQTNRVVKDTREKVGKVERAIMTIKDKLESSSGYLGMLAEGGKALMGFMKDKKTSKKSKGRRRKNKEEDEEEED
jgi:hypothetical protein